MDRFRANSRWVQRGAAALEFALVLPALLFLIYGTVVYGYLFIIYASMTYAAQEAAEVAVAVDPLLESGDYEATVTSTSRLAAAQILNWLPARQFAAIAGNEEGSNVVVEFDQEGAIDLVRVTLNFALEGGNFLPTIDLGAIQIPPLPGVILGESAAALGVTL